MWCFPAHNRHGSVLFSAISVCDWAMDPERESCPERHIQRPTHAPWWCFGADPVEESDTFLTVEVLLEATESEFTRMFFLPAPPAVTVRLQSENGKKQNKASLTIRTLFFNMFHIRMHCFAKWLVPEQSLGLKRPQHRWSLHCFLTFSFIRQWNKNTKNPGTEEQRHTHLSSCLLKCFAFHFYQCFVLFPSSTLMYYLEPNSLKCQLLHMRITSQKIKPHPYMSFKKSRKLSHNGDEIILKPSR